MSPIFFLLTACNGCEPELPRPDQDEDRQDTDEPDDTDSGGGDTDTGPPPLCDVEEIEPNNSAPQALPMEEWACGTFDSYVDPEWFGFETSQAGWVQVEVQAAARGTSADAQIQLIGDEGSAVLLDGYLTTDPKIVFPAPEPAAYEFVLGETRNGYGEDYGWWAMATLVKAPVEWNAEEAEPNDVLAEANAFTLGDTVFGTIEEAGDFDWYVLTFGPGSQKITFNVEAFVHGSPANLKIELYDAEGTLLRTDYAGEIDYDPDPWFEKRVVTDTAWYVLLRTEDDRGSPFHWYTLSVISTPET